MRLLALALLGVLTLSGCIADLLDAPEPVTYEAIRFDTTEGAFTVILYPEAAPETVTLYKDYVEQDYFVDRSFGRVVPGFVIQVTDRAAGSTEDDRTVPLETHTEYHFAAGAVGIARSADPNSGGSEFFVMDFASGHLDGNYTVFGQVIEGMDAVHRAARVPAVDWGTAQGATGQGPVLFDRWAVDPTTITATTLTTVQLSGEEAAKYPLQSTARVKDEEFAYTIDWDNDLREGHLTRFANYVRALDGETPVPAPSEVAIRIDGGDPIPVSGDDFDGIYHWNWSPRQAGGHEVAFWWDGAAKATFQVTVA